MALQSNQTQQMGKRLQAELQLLDKAATVSVIADGELSVSDSSGAIAHILMQRRSFNGFNIAYELSSSAGQGFPEHQCFLAVNSATSFENVALLTKACASMGCSEIQFIKSAAPALSDCTEANASLVIPNDARTGSVGA